MLDFRGTRVLCVGDIMLDRFMYGEVERISPEAPVPVVRLRETRAMLGGAGNVARNLAALGGEAVLLGLLGEDATGAEVAGLLAADAKVTNAAICSARRPTISKVRIIAGNQQVVRVDDETPAPADADEIARLVAAIEAEVPRCGAVILSDYAKGVLAEAVIQAAVRAATAAGIPVFVDPKGTDYRRYAGVTCVTPNLKELALATGMPVKTEADALAAARSVMAQTGMKQVLVTRSEKGMLLVPAEGEPDAVPARAKEVFDVSGAGDTVIATLSLAVASGAPLAEAMRIANAAAGVVVGKLGTATLSVEELTAALEAEASASPEAAGLLTLSETQRLVAEWQGLGLRVGFANGCFDILHAGHVSLLRGARARCDRLVVALNSDASVSRLKGPERPVNSLQDRATVIAALASVDAVVGFEQDTPFELIGALEPDVLIKGADYTVDRVVGADLVLARGGEVALIDLVPGRSTTGIVERLRHPGKVAPSTAA